MTKAWTRCGTCALFANIHISILCPLLLLLEKVFFAQPSNALPKIPVPLSRHFSDMNSASKVGEIFLAAGTAYSKLGEVSNSYQVVV